MSVIFNYIQETVSKHPKRPALAFKKNHKDAGYNFINYQELTDLINKFSAGLKAIGLKAQDKVGILSYNRPEWVIADLALLKLGSVSVAIHTVFSEANLAYVLKDSKIKILIAEPHLLNKIKKLPKNVEAVIYLKNRENQLYEQNSCTAQKKTYSFHQVLKKAEAQDLLSQNSASDNYFAGEVIIYTSGTTGDPKGVVLSEQNLLANVLDILQVFDITACDVFFSFLPLSHAFERTCGYLAPLIQGACIYYATDPKNLAEELPQVKPTILISVPRIYEKVYEKLSIKYQALSDKLPGILAKLAPKIIGIILKHKLGGRLRLAISGGASLNKKIALFFKTMGLVIYEGYGLTETAPVISCNRVNNYKLGTVGQVLPSVRLKMASDDEILVKGPNVMQGYLNLPEKTEEALDSDGWYRTGDLGKIREDGFLEITGRKKNIMVLSTGKNVAPEPIEQALKASKYISEVMLIGEGKKFISALLAPNVSILQNWAQRQGLSDNLLLILSSPEVSSLYAEEIGRLLKDFSEHEKLKKFILLPKSFSLEKGELTPSLKLKRKVIEENYKEKIEEMYG